MQTTTAQSAPTPIESHSYKHNALPCTEDQLLAITGPTIIESTTIATQPEQPSHQAMEPQIRIMFAQIIAQLRTQQESTIITTQYPIIPPLTTRPAATAQTTLAAQEAQPVHHLALLRTQAAHIQTHLHQEAQEVHQAEPGAN